MLDKKKIKIDGFKFASAVLSLFVIGFLLTCLFGRKYPMLWSMSLLSCVMGMQHAFDVDHISAIDNITRKLINERKDPNGTGFFFSLGHSLVVLLMTMLLVTFMDQIRKVWPNLKLIGGLIGSSFAGCILVLLALINMFIMRNVWKNYKNSQIGISDDSYKNSFIYRLFMKMLNWIDKDWQIVLVGFLFGLGFDTASQIGILAVSAMTASTGVPAFAILAFPILFMAGMCLWDTIDGFLMSSAYQWIFTDSKRKVFYNLTLTGLSVFAALFSSFVNLINAGQLYFKWNNTFVNWIGSLDFFKLGVILICLFVVVWSTLIITWRHTSTSKISKD
ncbi:MAG: HoxN/HupN/NixA family nickel/cobalt transporter [Lactobacillus sp.]|nr:HoxN/HupN/NixA family nickel/cobalt transporter [Lactobacillus sp.]